MLLLKENWDFVSKEEEGVDIREATGSAATLSYLLGRKDEGLRLQGSHLTLKWPDCILSVGS